MEYSKPNVESMGPSQLFYLDTTRHSVIDPTDGNYNRGFAEREKTLGTSITVRVEIPLNRYGFFQAFEDMLMSNCKVEI